MTPGRRVAAHRSSSAVQAALGRFGAETEDSGPGGRQDSSASDLAMAIALIAQMLNGQGSTLSIVVATDEAYQPYVELPIEFSATPSEGHVAVSSEMTVQELVSAVSLRMGQPCCGEQDGTSCPQTCKQERIRISLAPRQ